MAMTNEKILELMAGDENISDMNLVAITMDSMRDRIIELDKRVKLLEAATMKVPLKLVQNDGS
jgi:hypothetical protein